jgi:hypothetical protein
MWSRGVFDSTLTETLVVGVTAVMVVVVECGSGLVRVMSVGRDYWPAGGGWAGLLSVRGWSSVW